MTVSSVGSLVYADINFTSCVNIIYKIKTKRYSIIKGLCVLASSFNNNQLGIYFVASELLIGRTSGISIIYEGGLNRYYGIEACL
jgi:hypothetical protein